MLLPEQRGHGHTANVGEMSYDAMAGDTAAFLDDAVALEHTLAQYRALPRGQLAVVPGTSHLLPLEKPDLVNRLVVDFLDDGAVVSILPMRRGR